MAKTSKLEEIFDELDKQRLHNADSRMYEEFRKCYEAEMSKLIFDENPFLKQIPKENTFKSNKIK